MKLSLLVGAVAALGVFFSAPVSVRAEDSKAPLDFTVKDIDGKDVALSSYKGNVVLVVNVASKCGNTKQYTALEAVYQKYKDKGFTVLAFPANNFKGQEPGTDAEIKAFCTAADSKYKVTFPLFSKISVKDDDQHGLYKVLTAHGSEDQKAGPVTWNFEKFLIGRDGTVVDRFKPKTVPDDAKVTAAIERELAKGK